MTLPELHSRVHTLSRREKYRLVQFILRDLAEEESAEAADSSPETAACQDRQNAPSLQAQAVAAFLKKWKGYLRGIDPDAAKQAYLQEKYR